MYIDFKQCLCTKMIIADDSGPRPAQSPGAGCQQAAISRLPDISKAAPFCTREDGVALASLPA